MCENEAPSLNQSCIMALQIREVSKASIVISFAGICEPVDSENCTETNSAILFSSAEPFNCSAFYEQGKETLILFFAFA